jgi:hypothetical protein
MESLARVLRNLKEGLVLFKIRIYLRYISMALFFIAF